MISKYASFSMRWYSNSVSALTVQKYSLGKTFVISFELCIHNKIHFNRVLEIVTMNNNQKIPKTFLSLKNIDWRLLLFLCSIFRFFISYFFLFFGFLVYFFFGAVAFCSDPYQHLWFSFSLLKSYLFCNVKQ